ncbi:MAG: hypothetical protein HRU19_13755 [Pseudobacteriovorax sp.]|nr:hypothetical protein [Pseudobacteriovorax sp.]
MKRILHTIIPLLLLGTSAQAAQITYYGRGNSWDLERFGTKGTTYPQMFYNANVVGTAVAKSSGRIYTWLANGKVFSGNQSNMTQYRAPYNYSSALGTSKDQILGIAIHPTNDNVYTWYDNGTYSIGRSNDLDRYSRGHSFSLPPGKSFDDIIDMGIAGTSKRVYTWYKDGTVTVGTASDLDFYKSSYDYSPDYPGGCHDKWLQGVGIKTNNNSDRVISLHSYWVC